MTGDTLDNGTTKSGTEGPLLANRYRIVKQLGQGGMGNVWLAEDTQLDNRQFAIKMLPSILVRNGSAYRQLKDEALVAMQLVHSNIVQIRAFEENDGNPFLVMDYIDGRTLDDYLAEVGRGERGGLPEDEVIRILKPIAAALDYAHGEGVVHRDVKPANVMIRKDGHPFILDFGIAREIHDTISRAAGKAPSGTLRYMSPEQLNGSAPSASQDIYSFAAMAYECIKGTPPFSHGQIEHQILNSPPESLHGGRCSASIMDGLAKKPEDRPSTCVAVLGGAGSAFDSRAMEVSRGSKRKAVVPIAVLSVLVSLVLLIIGICYAMRTPTKESEVPKQTLSGTKAKQRAKDDPAPAVSGAQLKKFRARQVEDAKHNAEMERLRRQLEDAKTNINAVSDLENRFEQALREAGKEDAAKKVRKIIQN